MVEGQAAGLEPHWRVTAKEPGCQNCASLDVTHEAKWRRRLDIDTGGEGNRKAEFKPKLRVSFYGFTNDNVCPGSVGQIRIDHGFFAGWRVCYTHYETDPQYGSGWAYGTHFFQAEGGEFKLTAAGYTSPDFNITDTCQCSDESTEQHIDFETSVSINTGITLGST